MAEWRARGYVADSDDENESQDSYQPVATRVGTASASQDGVRAPTPHRWITDVLNPNERKLHDEDDGDFYKINRGEIASNTDTKSEKGTTAVLETSRDDEPPHGRFRAKGDDGEQDGGLQMGDNGDLDELQVDHYVETSAAKLQENQFSRTREAAKSTPPRQSPLSQRVLSLSSISSPTSDLFEESNEVSSSADILRNKPAGQICDEESSERNNNASLSHWEQSSHVTAVGTEPTKRIRTLRHRNPIQLHPYAIESEKYRQILKARGVKPLRISQMEAEVASARGEEPQNIEYQEGEIQNRGGENAPEEFPSSSPIDSHDTSDELAGSRDDIPPFGDDDLPDVGALLSHPSRSFIDNGHKRLKIAQPSFRMPPGMHRNVHRSTSEETPIIAHDDRDAIYDMPLSPPQSGSRTPTKTTHTRFPTDSSTLRQSRTTMPTPATSSEPRKPLSLETSEEELSDGLPYNRTVESTSITCSDSDDSDLHQPSERRVSNQLQRVQRKIRGVLPASWLKIDLKTQKKQSSNINEARRSPSSGKTAVQRGVAQPITVRRSKDPHTPALYGDVFPLSDSELSAPGNNDRQLRPPAEIESSIVDDRNDMAFFGDRFGEAAEDDHIDAMLPSTVRRNHHRRKDRKRQLKIATPSKQLRSVARCRPNQPQISGKHSDSISNGRPPNLSILDHPSCRDTSKTSMPQFLKIASRAVRSRKDKGRHSPSRKYLRLATQNDNEEANETLHHWREGTIVPMSFNDFPGRPDRQPLYPRSVNNAVRPIAGNRRRSSSAIKPTPHSIPAKRQLTTARRTKIQSSLDDIAFRQSENTAGPVEMAILQETMEQPKNRKTLASLIQGKIDPRPAMLETSKGDGQKLHSQTIFQQVLSKIDHFDDECGLQNVLRLFKDDGKQLPYAEPARGKARNKLFHAGQTNVGAKKHIVHRRRKIRPKHMDVAASWSKHPSPPIIIDDLPDSLPTGETQYQPQKGIVSGLGSFGAWYSDDFGIAPLPAGICFDNSTFLGSGALVRSLKLGRSSVLDSFRGFQVLHFGGKTYKWGPWNDTVSSELGEMMPQIGQSDRARLTEGQQELNLSLLDDAVSALKAIVAYFSDHLSFLDPVDRYSCVQRCSTLVSQLFLDMDDECASTGASPLQIRTVGMVFAGQIRQISQNRHVSPQLQDEIELLVQRVAQKTMSLALRNGVKEFETCMSYSRLSDAAEYMLGDQHTSIESFVAAHHVLMQGTGRSVDFWKSVHIEVPVKSPDGTLDIRPAEESWKRLFTLLPFLEFDGHGVLELGRRLKVPFDNWLWVKKLMSPILDACLLNSQGQQPSFNEYLRALFRRCLHLINGWGWWRCEPIIGTLFDFFARKQLAHLRNEESHGSPRFLIRLAENPSLKPEPEDRCFHLLLKIIGSGIKHMRQFYTDKKIRDITWRLMPNHGRSHPKEEAIFQAHLDALRNHHDLLCTLYWASPPSCRPRLTAIRNLVHLETSHREACHINIRAWFNLVKFQLSTDESVSCLDAFLEWHNDLLIQILLQHSKARTEAEEQVRSIQHTEGLLISNELLESTIAKNQRQVEATLSDALVSLKLAVDAAQDERAAAGLISTQLSGVFDIFDVGKPQRNKTVIQALDVLSALANKNAKLQQPRPCAANDDSQDYGDWPSFEDDENTLPVTREHKFEPLLQKFQEPLRHLRSNCFGSDLIPDDALLLKTVDTWVTVAQELIRNGTRSWNDYFDRFGKDSWDSLRDTEQTRKYTAYYLAILIERDRDICAKHTDFLLKSWIGTLVERESLLKFQHRLTEALLNARCDSPILNNLPFWKRAASGRFGVSAADFAERRISLISSVLANMRESLEKSVAQSSSDTMLLRQQYKDVLKDLMGTMKRNYQALGQGNIRGAYVDFVQKVIGLLQQYTSTICPVDRFFTDSGAFPLPATDPTYVVGQLKNYALRLQESRTPKQLAMFLQSVSERGAVDGQQPYLVSQLHRAMSNVFEDDTSTKPTLRSFLIKAIIPAYVELSCTSSGSPCGWILALPYLQALQMGFKELLLDVDGANVHSVRAAASIISAFLRSIRHSFGKLLDRPGALEESGILKLMSACYSAITTVLPTFDYIIRQSGPAQGALKNIGFLRRFATYISARLQDHGCSNDLEIEDVEYLAYADTRHFAMQELRDSLTKNWVYDRHEQQFHYTRGASRREVLIDVGLHEEEKANLLAVFADFFNSLGAMPALHDEDDDFLDLRQRRVRGLDTLLF